MRLIKPRILLGCALLAASPFLLAGSFIGGNTGTENRVSHVVGYDGVGGHRNINICISPESTITSEMVVPLNNVITRFNQLQPNRPNIAWLDDNDVPVGAHDLETLLVHEVGHCAGALGHSNLGGLPVLELGEWNFAKSTVGNNGVFDLDAGADNVAGSEDDLRGDDVNLFWFNRTDNNPFEISEVVDATTYSRDIALLPNGDSYPRNPWYFVSGRMGYTNSEAVMLQGQSADLQRRVLLHDDVATIRYGQSGLDSIQGTADDYTFQLNYQGITDTNCDVTVVMSDASSFGTCVAYTSATAGHEEHNSLVSGTIYINDQRNWFFNQIPVPTTDSDGDGLFDGTDNCVDVYNPSQIDTDHDGFGNHCDADFNNDCDVNFIDLGEMKDAFFGSNEEIDLNADGAVNFIDLGIMKSAFFAAPGPSGLRVNCNP